MPVEVDRIVFPVSIHDAENRGQSFGQVRDAFVRVVDQTGGAGRPVVVPGSWP
ncbi:TerD domain-containing protein OS=Streptomyces fumanus OX=67302 GN=GCM10018772_19680 PE=4 SV=1 [Streptomyces fumanus]|uniref:TerD domain-containing protein n=1 Tax=Streptomyces fumanus TaxID=67302 RepID=A0A919DZ38_9ACTN|nr:hypothetical protein GCM10018772_19680 [Streptomyces fumanus]